MHLRVRDLTPPAKSGAQLVLLVSSTSAELPIGLNGIVLGVDPRSMLIVGPIPVDASGGADLGVRVARAWDGAHVFVQALYLDPRARSLLVFSDSRSMTLGSAAPELVLSADPATGTGTDIVRLLSDGRAGTPLSLTNLTLQDLDLASVDESRTFRDDLPRKEVFGGLRMVRLTDGSHVLRYARGGRQGLLRIHASGRVERIIERELNDIEPCILASRSHLAFATDSHRLFLYRLGSGSGAQNWPGTPSPLKDVTPTGNIDFAETSLVFGASVLAFIDEQHGLYLVPLTGGTPVAPSLPPSGGVPPKEFDPEVAVSGDGHSFAFGAGKDQDFQDVYVVRDDGRAVNVTRRPTIYADVGYANPGRRIELALSYDGSLVSWVDRTVRDDANYVSPVKLPAPNLITGGPTFKCIDIGTTARFAPKGGILIVAGQSDSTLDLFFSPTMQKKDVIPLTKTATNLVPPYASDSKLTLLDIATVPGIDPYLVWAKHLKGYQGMWVIDTAARDTRLIARAHAGHGVLLPGTHRVVIDDGPSVLFVDATNRQAMTQRVTLGTAAVTSIVRGPTGAKIFVRSGTQTLWAIDTRTRKPTKLATGTDFGSLLAGTNPGGELFVLSPKGPRGRSLLRWRAGDGMRAVGGTRLRFFLQ